MTPRLDLRPARLALPVSLALLLGLGIVLTDAGSVMPAYVSANWVNGTLILGAGLAAAFSMGRLSFSCLAVLIAAQTHPGHARELVALTAMLLPLNLALFAALRERPILSESSVLRAFLLVFQVVVVWRLVDTRPELAVAMTSWAQAPAALGWPAGAGAAAVSLGGSLVVLGVLIVRRDDAVAQGAFVASALGVYGALDASASGTKALLGAALSLLLVALIQAWRLAFRDGLTGLPARRTLDARLRGLSGDYALAMVDVDHFKRFNDTYGHEAGDQVLRLVARHLERVPGATPFRYGGEEFALVFPGRTTADALPALEALRAAIAAYPFRVRGPRRPGDRRGQKRRGAGEGDQGDGGQRNDDKDLRVTVSIGVADPAAAGDDPLQVLAAADEALYRAKRGGRDRVARKGRRRSG